MSALQSGETAQADRSGWSGLRLALLLGLLVVVTRAGLLPGQLFSFDDVNFAYALGEFDIRKSQPQPPGYPLFVLEMRLMELLRFKRPESILWALQLLGSIAAVVLVARAAEWLFSREAGICAGFLFLFHSTFFYGSLTSALRPQLAVISAAVAIACFRAASGEARWVYVSAVLLGFGSGVRPELGLVLFPLWAWSLWKAPVSFATRLLAGGLLAVSVAAWFLPAAAAVGGPFEYIRICREYLADQASVYSGLFGSGLERWFRTLVWLGLWVFSGLLAWPLLLPLIWRQGRLPGREKTTFLGLWLIPQVIFAAAVHIADPGQALGMVAAVSVIGGGLAARAMEQIRETPSTGLIVLLAAAAGVACLSEHGLWFTPLVLWVAGFVLRAHSAADQRPVARPYVLILPAIVLQLCLFLSPAWDYTGSGTGGPLETVRVAVHQGLAANSLDQIQATVGIDDATLRAARRLIGSYDGPSVVIWEGGPTAWRKVAYYLPDVPVIALDRTSLRAGSAAVATVWKGPEAVAQHEGSAPVRVPIPLPARLIWLVAPGSPPYRGADAACSLQPEGPVFYCDTTFPGEADLGPYRLDWATGHGH